jgi:HD-like signal output (HDOD) protein
VRGLRKDGGGTFDYQSFWRRSVICATATLSVGTLVHAGSRDELLLAGLLQDIGMLVLNQTLPAYGHLAASANRNHSNLVEIERKELDTDHAQVGSWFLRRWHLPSRLIAAVSASHELADINEPLVSG